MEALPDEVIFLHSSLFIILLNHKMTASQINPTLRSDLQAYQSFWPTHQPTEVHLLSR